MSFIYSNISRPCTVNSFIFCMCLVCKGSGFILWFRPMTNSYMSSGNWLFELFEVWYGSPYFSHKSIKSLNKSAKLNPQISRNPWNPRISLKSMEKYSDLSENPQVVPENLQIDLLLLMSVTVLAASLELFNCLWFWYILFFGFLNFQLSYFERGCYGTQYMYIVYIV